MPKACEPPFYKNVRVVLCKKPLKKKNTKYSRNCTMLKIVHLAKGISDAKAIVFGTWSVGAKNLKCHKHAKNHFIRTLESFCAKKKKI